MKILHIAKTSTVGLTLAVCLGGLPMNAQKGHGGSSSSAGMGRGTSATHGQMGRQPSQGMSDRQPEGKPGIGQEQRNTKDAMPDNKSSHQQKTTAEQLASNQKLSGKLQGLFPVDTDLSAQADGFKSVGDFVAAAHVSHNLGIPFTNLKGKILSGKSLGQAIHDLKPEADSAGEANRAIAKSKKLLRETGI
jgi:hypothetical protein